MEELLGIRGFIIDAPGFGSLRAYRNGGLIVERGRIAAIGEYDDVRRSERGPKTRWIDHGPNAAVLLK